MANRVLINPQILSDIAEAIRYRYGMTDKIKPVDMAEIIRGINSDEVKEWYVWYMSNIAPIDGMYNSHSYSNVYVVGNELIVLYRSAPHHFSDASFCKMRVSRTNLKTFESTSEDVLDGLNYFGSVYCDGTYYVFDKSMYRYDTTDFRNFNKVAYTVPSGASEPYYITVGDNNRFISTHSNSSKKGCMMYSDDYGLTWKQATGDGVYNATLTSHGATTKVGNTLVAYCQATKIDNATNNETTLNVLTSTDNGLTWSGAEAIDEELKYCGPSFTTGMFAQIGDELFLCMSSRLQTTDEEGHIHLGNVRLFRGSAEDVINGIMSLYAVVDDFNTKCTSITVPSNVSMTDTGNIGMTTDGSNLYIVYAKPLMQQASSGTDWITSNSMLCMAVVNSVNRNIGKEDSYYNAEWETERDAFVEAKDVEHDLYIYGSGTTVITNANGIEIMTPETNQDAYGNNAMASGYVVPNVDIQIPFVDYFEMRMIFGLANRFISPDYHKHYYGINVDGIKHALTGSTNIYKFNESNSTSCTASLTTGQQLCDFKLKYEKGIVSATLNGITVDDVQSYVVTDFSGFNDTENTAYLTFDALAQIVLSGTGIGTKGLMALVVDTDGDISSLLDENVEEPDEPENPDITVENPVTDGLTRWFDVNDIVVADNSVTWTDKIASTSFPNVSSYDSSSKLVTLSGTANLGKTGDIASEDAIAIEFVNDGNSTPVVHSQFGKYNADIQIDGNAVYFGDSQTQYLYNDWGTNVHKFNEGIFHILLNMDYANNKGEVYINGKLEFSATSEIAENTVRNWNIMDAGKGKIGTLRIYNRVLTAEEVVNNYKYEQNTYTFAEI